MGRVITLVLAAGKSQRFRDVGYKLMSKQFLSMPDGQDLLEHVLRGLSDNTHIVASNNANKWDVIEFNLYDNVIWIEGNNGSLNATIQGLNQFINVYPDQELLVVYSDILFDDYDRFIFKCRLADCMSGVVLFWSTNDRLGYHEKNWAYGGIYYFSSFYSFLHHAKDKPIGAGVEDNLSNKPFLYKVDVGMHIELGVPEEYERYIKRCEGK